MAFVVDTRGSHEFDKEEAHLDEGDTEGSDDDFKFIPLKPEHRCPRFFDSTEVVDYNVDETYPQFRKLNSTQKKNGKKREQVSSGDKLTSVKSKTQSKKSNLLIAKSTTLQPGLEKLERIPSYSQSKQVKQRQRKAEQKRTKGSKWFNLPAPEITEEIKNDIEALQMRSALDPKHFYKKNDMKHIPKYFQIGRVVDSPADFYSSRVPKKERKRTLVDDLLADAEFQRQTKRRYKEIISERQKTTLQYVRQKRRQQKKKNAKSSKSSSL